MQFRELIKNLKFVTIHDNDYDFEPIIEFDNGKKSTEIYTYSDFVELIDKCKRLGLEHKHLIKHLDDLKKVYTTYTTMKEPEMIPASM